MTRWLGNGLMLMGLGLLVVTGLLFGYGEYERFRFEQDVAFAERLDAATATAEAIRETVGTATASGLATATAVARARETPTPAVVPSTAGSRGVDATPAPPVATATPIPPTATPTAVPVVLRRVQAPTIGLDAAVVESKIVGGEWQVPKFVAGHLEGTALPGSGSNIVLSGHLQSISSGNVFARIAELQAGDDVVLKTNLGDVRYKIEGKNIVKNDDLSVVQPTPREELTLITCTGTFNPLIGDYTQRWVIWGVRVP